MSKQCLNCNQTVDNNFCPHCGQNAAIQRFSLKQFFLNDLVNNLLNIDKGFFYTIKELITRPGHSIREYIEGKRVNHFNYLTFVILIITIGHIVGNISEIKLIDTTYYFSKDKDLITDFDRITSAYPKLFILIRVPFLALFTLLFFKKSKKNFTEHLILNVYKVCGELIIAITFTLIAIVIRANHSMDFIFTVVGILTFVFSVWYYFQFFSAFGYSKISLLIRSVLTTIIIFLIVVTLTTFLIGMEEGFNDR